ncbi:MAG: GNAT family N-acetyltransferase [Myxococcales bacterium]|nr:GNAT family N-acetyltransferase [Myxococcales bacterium]MCB9709215.1 GNAT family N-acetyltransferase [Myxococcales bacterium]
MISRGITKQDYDYIVAVLDRWFGGLAHDRAHPVFFYELGEKALIAEEHGETVGFLLGFTIQSSPSGPITGYIHLVGIKPESRRQGVGRALYDTFIKRCVAGGATRIKAIAPIANDESARFHRALGFSVKEDINYAGPGRGRLVFLKDL